MLLLVCVCVCVRVCVSGCLAFRRPCCQNVLNKHTHWHPVFQNSHYYSFSLLLSLFYLFIYQIHIIMVIHKRKRLVTIKGVCSLEADTNLRGPFCYMRLNKAKLFTPFLRSIDVIRFDCIKWHLEEPLELH